MLSLLKHKGGFLLPNFTLRLPTIKLEKLRFIAEYNARSANKEIEHIISKHIDDFEKTHGKIKVLNREYDMEP